MISVTGDADWFGNGSRVIVTTRYRHLIKKDDAIYEVPTLPDHEAMQLFNKLAFQKEVPDECLKELSLEVVDQAKGLPLALKVWGSLFHKKDPAQWRRTVDQIKKNSNSEIVEKLKISYDGLEPEEQEIFLDIACFLRGSERTSVMQILESCDFGAEYGLDVLIDKSLVFISEKDKIEMHDLIQDMGRYVVKMQKNPGERSRIWDAEDFKEVITDNTGSMAVEAIWFACFEEICFNTEAMNKMKRLRILSIFGGFAKFFASPPSSNDSEDASYDLDCRDDSIQYLPDNLRWLEWIHYPWKSLPENFKPRNLVHLCLQRSSLHYFWTETQDLPCLRNLDLSVSKSLIRTPDFTGMPNLEYLVLEYCTNLEEIHYSLGFCKKLIELNLNWCSRLWSFPWVNGESLESMDLQYCYRLGKLPEILGRMKPELVIHSTCCGIRELPSCLQYPTHLTELDLSGMENIEVLPSSICKLKCLVKLDVSDCYTLESLPKEIGDLENLEKLDATSTLISRPPPSIVHLNKLKSLKFVKEKTEDEVYFVFPPVNDGLRSLEVLKLGSSKFIDGRIPEDIGRLSSLKKLHLKGDNFEHLPQSIAQLGALRVLHLTDCRRLTQLPEFPPQLDTIYADWSNDWICNSLFQNISSLQHDISVSDSLSLRVFTSWSWDKKVLSWFHHQGMGASVSFNLHENWYVSDNFLGFAICYCGQLRNNTVDLILSCNDGMSLMTQKLSLCNHSEELSKYAIHFFLVPFAGLWDKYKANGKIPNDCKCVTLSSSEELEECGVRLLYKDEADLQIGMRRSRDEEASCSSSKKQKSQFP